MYEDKGVPHQLQPDLPTGNQDINLHQCIDILVVWNLLSTVIAV